MLSHKPYEMKLKHEAYEMYVRLLLRNIDVKIFSFETHSQYFTYNFNSIYSHKISEEISWSKKAN